MRSGWSRAVRATEIATGEAGIPFFDIPMLAARACNLYQQCKCQDHIPALVPCSLCDGIGIVPSPTYERLVDGPRGPSWGLAVYLFGDYPTQPAGTLADLAIPGLSDKERDGFMKAVVGEANAYAAQKKELTGLIKTITRDMPQEEAERFYRAITALVAAYCLSCGGPCRHESCEPRSV